MTLHLRHDFGDCLSNGAWAESTFLKAVNQHPDYFAIAYGLSGAPKKKLSEILDCVVDYRGEIKRPDLLIFRREHEMAVEKIITKHRKLAKNKFGDVGDDRMMQTLGLSCQNETSYDLARLLKRSCMAIEVETSEWMGQAMKNFHKQLKPQDRANGELGLAVTASGLPHLILKVNDDWNRLTAWTKQLKRITDHDVPIHFWAAFCSHQKKDPEYIDYYDQSEWEGEESLLAQMTNYTFGIGMQDVRRLIKQNIVRESEQTYNKDAYTIPYQHCYSPVIFVEPAVQWPVLIHRRSGHLEAKVRTRGGKVRLTEGGKDILADPSKNWDRPYSFHIDPKFRDLEDLS